MPVAFITGASRGIGRATALALAEAGYDCVLAARTVSGGEVHNYSPTQSGELTRAMPGSLEESAELVRARGQKAAITKLDLLQRESVEAAAEFALSAFGQIDLLINNAGYQGPGTMDFLLDLELETIATAYRVNLVHPVRLVQCILPAMLKRDRGAVINVVSGAGMNDPAAPPDSGGWGFVHGSSKAALIRMAGCLRAEHPKSRVRFFNLEPGLVLVESMKAQGIDEELIRRYGGAPPEVPAAAMRWLATDPGAKEWDGKIMHAQEFAAEHKLLPNWPPPKQGGN